MAERSWIIITAVIVTLALTAVAFSTPSMIFAPKIAILDSELRESSGEGQYVLTKLDLGDAEQLASIPTTLGPWNLSQEREWDKVAELLDTNVLLSRDYERADLFQTVNLLIVSSGNVSSFHPAEVCYEVQGWEVQGEGEKVRVHIPNATWAQSRWLSDTEPYLFQGNISTKLLSVEQEVNGTAIRRVALYAYLKHEDWHVTRDVTWIRAEIEVPSGTEPQSVAPILGSLFAETVPHIFSLREEEKMVWELVMGR